MKLAASILLACATCAATTTALAQKAWKIGSAAQPGTVLVGFVDEVAQKVTADSKGEIKTERLFVGSEQELVQQVVRGRLEMASVSYTGASVLIPEASLLNMPYLWVSSAERDHVTDKHALPVMKKIYEAKGLVILGLGEVGWNDVVCKTACLTPASVKGMKVRVSPSSASKMFWSSVGANGVQMPLSELFPALQSGLVDAADLPFPYYVTTPAAQSAPHYVLTQHLHHGSTVVVNKAVWDGLSPELRKVVAGSAPDVARLRKAVDDELRPKMDEFKKKGGFVHELTPAQRAEWRKLVEPHQEALVKEIGGAAPELWAAIQKGKKEYAASGGK
ncbi:MAG: TRAP transporter substrate-binding protein [Burkholderiaceae bacterium]|nr:TRAP transporter substrate-binding protein [Burkholderiaceae bacterium]